MHVHWQKLAHKRRNKLEWIHWARKKIQISSLCDYKLLRAHNLHNEQKKTFHIKMCVWKGRHKFLYFHHGYLGKQPLRLYPWIEWGIHSCWKLSAINQMRSCISLTFSLYLSFPYIYYTEMVNRRKILSQATAILVDLFTTYSLPCDAIYGKK